MKKKSIISRRLCRSNDDQIEKNLLILSLPIPLIIYRETDCAGKEIKLAEIGIW